MAKTTIDKLAADVEKILKDYAEDTNKDMTKLVKEFGKKGAKAVKSASSGIGGKYASGWTSQVEETRQGAVATIYSNRPGLPHLLEKGHATRNGGRVAGRTHIAPVEEKLVEEFTKAVQNDL